MEIKSAISTALGLTHPWQIQDIKFSKAAKGKHRVDVTVAPESNHIFKDKSGTACKITSYKSKPFKYFDLWSNECSIILKIPQFASSGPCEEALDTPFIKQLNSVDFIIQLLIRDKFDKEIEINEGSFQGRSPLKIMEDSFNLKGYGNDLIGLAPEILCGYIAGKKFRQNVILEASKQVGNLRQCEGVLLCHALSPLSESIGFYCDIGRAYRISAGLGIKMKVMLAGEDWTNYNWVVKDLKLENNLLPNQTWRTAVYDKLGIEHDLCTIEDSKKHFKADKLLHKNDLRTLANDYLQIVKKCWGPDIDKEPLSNEKVEEILKQSNPFFDLASIKVLSTELKPFKTTITCILRNFHRVDKETFLYFLTQYYYQSRYQGWLKVSMQREKDFDDSFIEISTSKSLFEETPKNTPQDHLDFSRLYFEDYVYGYLDEATPLTAHPYYFPSGTIFQYFKDDPKKTVANCIMIRDSNIEKITSILNKLKDDYFSKARIISDLLSFAHLMSTKKESVRNVVKSWMKKNKETDTLWSSWELYTRPSNNFSTLCRNWSELIFSNWMNHKSLHIPYHFLPFLWQGFVSVEEEARLIYIILEEARMFFDEPYPLLPDDIAK